MHTIQQGVTDGNITEVTGINPGDVLANSSFEKLQDKSKIIVSSKPIPASTSGSNAP
jgi:multidrug efflux system membrane fusion protein